MFKHLRANIRKIQLDDPAAPGKLQILLTYPGLHALIWHRVNHFLFRHRLRFLARWGAFFARMFTNIEIHPGAQIAKGVMIDHGTGLVVGETAVVGEGSVLFHGATLGGTGNERGKRHPTLGKNVLVGTGAKVLGNITIGDNCRIAANAVVLKDIPPNCTVVGIPGRIVRQDGKKIRENCTQSEALAELQAEIARMKQHIAGLEQTVQLIEEEANSRV